MKKAKNERTDKTPPERRNFFLEELAASAGRRRALPIKKVSKVRISTSPRCRRPKPGKAKSIRADARHKTTLLALPEGNAILRMRKVMRRASQKDKLL